MYTNPQSGQVAAGTATAPTAYRRTLMDLLAASPVITDEEYDRATARILACQDVATLQKWYRNTIREIARREEAMLITAPVVYATAVQKEEIIRLCNRHEISRPEKTKVLARLDQLHEAEATALIGDLWAKVLARSGGSAYPAPPADGWSKGQGDIAYPNAA